MLTTDEIVKVAHDAEVKWCDDGGGGGRSFAIWEAIAKAARLAALEESAMVCVQHSFGVCVNHPEEATGAEDCADAIRALAGGEG